MNFSYDHIATHYLWPLYLDRHRCTKDTVVLAGTGRSGTTWISNIINYDNEYRYLFEPFNPLYVESVREANTRRYFRIDLDNKRLFKTVGDILQGRIRNKWVDRLNRKRIVRRRLIKDIRVSHLLGWMKRHFPDVKIVLLLRHPFAVADSKLRARWSDFLEEFLSQPDLIEDHLEPFEGLIRRAASPFQRHVLQWCVENYVPLRQLGPGEVHIAFYEEFCVDPYLEIGSLFEYLEKRISRKAYDRKVVPMLRTPSAMAGEDSAIKIGKSLLSGWTRRVDSKDVAGGVKILESFGFDGLYSNALEPNPAAVRERSYAHCLVSTL